MTKSSPDRRVPPAKHPPSSVSGRVLSSVVRDVMRQSSAKDHKADEPGRVPAPKHK